MDGECGTKGDKDRKGGKDGGGDKMVTMTESEARMTDR
jgi:hypothetical protein